MRAGSPLVLAGLSTAAQLRLDPPGLDLEVEPVAHGQLRLASEDGWLVRFPRALCRLRAGDGRAGPVMGGSNGT